VVNNRTRVYYKLTETGFNTAREKVNELEEFIATIKILISPNPALQYVPVIS
jgi:predicted transcriptional regulator